jgi:hypothetical protein
VVERGRQSHPIGMSTSPTASLGPWNGSTSRGNSETPPAQRGLLVRLGSRHLGKSTHSTGKHRSRRCPVRLLASCFGALADWSRQTWGLFAGESQIAPDAGDEIPARGSAEAPRRTRSDVTEVARAKIAVNHTKLSTGARGEVRGQIDDPGQ